MKLITTALLLTSVSAMAGTVSYSSSCVLEGYSTVDGGQSCVNNPTGADITHFDFFVPKSSATTNITTNSISGPTVSLSGTGSAFGMGTVYPDRIEGGSYIATSVGTYSQDLYTAGPARLGYMIATINYNNSRSAESPDIGSTRLQLNGLVDPNSFFADQAVSLGCGVNYLSNSCDSLIGLLNYSAKNNPFLVDLGTPFDLTFTSRVASAGGGQNADNYYGSAYLDITIQFSLFEMDGTPVNVFTADPATAPEPSTLGAMGVGSILLIHQLRKRRAI